MVMVMFAVQTVHYTKRMHSRLLLFAHHKINYTHIFIHPILLLQKVSFLHVYHHVSIAWAWWYAMTVFPGGDSYFGALLNSWIHVMMYSYYALSLLKIRCPWKRYLTQAQLLQFLSVLVYTGASYWKLKDSTTWAQQTAWIVQTGEMVSLFLLFLHFYQRAYASKKKAAAESRKNSDDSADTAAEQASLSSASTDEADEQASS